MSQAQADFIAKYNDVVQRLTAGTGIFPETIFAQAIVESQKNGLIPGTTLSTKYNNYFGIKDSSDWDGDVVNLSTGEVYNGVKTIETDGFRVYATPEDSFNDYIDFLQNNSRYANAGVFNAQNFTEQINDIANAGYATNPGYAQLLNNVANSISKFITPLNIGIGVFFVGILLITFFYYYKQST